MRRYSLLLLFFLALACRPPKPKELVLLPPSPNPEPVPRASPGFALAFSPDGTLAAVLKDGALRVLELQGEAPSSKPFSTTEDISQAQSLAITTKSLAVGFASGEIKLFPLQENAASTSLNDGGNISSLVLSLDGRILGVGYHDGVVAAYETTQQTQLLRSEEKDAHKDRVTALSLTQDGTQLLSGSDDRTLRLWSLSESKLVVTMTGHSRAIWSATISPKGDIAVSTSEDGSSKGWELPSGKEKFFRVGSVRLVAGRSDGARVVAVKPGGFSVWDFSSGLELSQKTEPFSSLRAVALSPDGGAFWIFTKEGELLRYSLPAEVFPEPFVGL